MNPMIPWIIFAVVMLAGIGVMIFLYYKGTKMQKQQEEQRIQLLNNAQSMKILVIDKKRMPLRDAGLPQIVIDQTPKRARGTKVPVVKAKIGPKIMTLIADEDVYDLIPVKAEIRAMISGIYITSINNFRKAPVPEPEKKGFFAKLMKKSTDASKKVTQMKIEEEKNGKNNKKSEKKNKKK